MTGDAWTVPAVTQDDGEGFGLAAFLIVACIGTIALVCGLVKESGHEVSAAPKAGSAVSSEPRSCLLDGYYIRPDGALLDKTGRVIVDAQGVGNVRAIHIAMVKIGGAK
jgi:hypothetical protein